MINTTIHSDTMQITTLSLSSETFTMVLMGDVWQSIMAVMVDVQHPQSPKPLLHLQYLQEGKKINSGTQQ